eukprot:GHVR01054255.1.p2 GENE.GHVR01054255.1~~GHVR01054255.1.p2  ORF type:complete len:151 (-),score=29.42 GHVR01054255.1:213-665(-)
MLRMLCQLMGSGVKADHLGVVRRIREEVAADAEHLAQQRFVHDLGRGANGTQGAVLQHADTVAKGGLVQVMQRDDGGGWQALDQLEDRQLVPDIKVVRRLVQQQHLRPLCQGARDMDALLFTARQRVPVPVAKCCPLASLPLWSARLCLR